MISTCSQLRAQGRADLKGRWAEAAMFTFVIVVIYLFASAIGSAFDAYVFGARTIVINDMADPYSMFRSTSGWISWLMTLLLLPMGWGFNVAFLGNHRHESDDPFGLGNAFAGYRAFGRVFFTMFVVSLVELLCFIPYVASLLVMAMLSGTGDPTMTLLVCLGCLLFAIPGIWMALRLSMVPYILRDYPGLGVTATLGLSARIMAGHKWKLFCLMFSFVGWVILCIFTLCIGLFWVMPYMAQTEADFYEEVKADYESLKEV